ncbi:unnamed protein product [Urochloa humidicola]
MLSKSLAASSHLAVALTICICRPSAAGPDLPQCSRTATDRELTPACHGSVTGLHIVATPPWRIWLDARDGGSGDDFSSLSPTPAKRSASPPTQAASFLKLQPPRRRSSPAQPHGLRLSAQQEEQRPSDACEAYGTQRLRRACARVAAATAAARAYAE